jgi:serine protease Do
MSTKKSSIFYAVLISLGSLVVGMVIAARLDLTPASLAGTVNVPTSNSAPLTGVMDATTFRTIAHAQGPAVVSILTRAKGTSRNLGEFFGFQFQNPRRGGGGNPQLPEVRGAGSGFIIDKAGYILTNNHVVEGATEIEVKLDGMDDLAVMLPAKVIGRDVLTDSALIQLTELPRQPLTEVKFGDSAQMEPGDWVMAIGNPFQLSNSVTVGVVSAVGRSPVDLQPISGRDLEMIQTDAAINKGNSGGPLLNIRGEVIGINTAILSDGGGNVGIGFAVPINTVRDILPQLRQGKVVRGLIGVNVSRIPMTLEDAKELYGLPGVMGAVVHDVVPAGPAATAGIKASDVITEFNGRPVKASGDLVSMVTATAPGTTVPVKIVRGGKTQTLNVKVGELNVDAEQQQAAASAPARPGPSQPKDTGFGMRVEPITPDISQQLHLPKGKGGAVVTDVDPSGAAALGQVLPGDVILAVNNQEVSSVDAVTQALDRVAIRRTAGLLIWRDGQEEYVQMRKR